MSYKFKYDELIDNDPTGRQNSTRQTQNASDEFYPSDSYARNVCFVPLSGNMFSLNYAYLVKMAYFVEESRIELIWTTDKVALTGINLKSLYFDLFHHLPKIIVCKDIRYNATIENDVPIVNDIQLQPNE